MPLHLMRDSIPRMYSTLETWELSGWQQVSILRRSFYNLNSQLSWVRLSSRPQEVSIILIFWLIIAKKIIIEGCKQSNAQTFAKIGESKELAGRSGITQDSVKITEDTPVNLIKFIVAEGHEEFTSVHSVEIAWKKLTTTFYFYD